VKFDRARHERFEAALSIAVLCELLMSGDQVDRMLSGSDPTTMVAPRFQTTRDDPFNPRAVQRRRELVLLALAQDPKAEAADVAEFEHALSRSRAGDHRPAADLLAAAMAFK
jgi:hypothetical protein